MRIDPPIDRAQTSWLGATALLTFLPHAPYLPDWLWPLCALLLCYALASLWRGKRTWRLLTVAAGVALAVGITVSFRKFFGKEPGLAMLSGLLALKLLETRSPRDARVVVFLCLFLQLGLFLNTQSILTGLSALLATWVALQTLIKLQAPELAWRPQLRTGSLLLLQGLPLMLTLFVLFPRVQGPLWGLPEDAFVGVTGLSDSMSPGSFGELIASDEVALRASFQGSPPPAALRYWRGPVLTRFDGRTWRPAPASTHSTPAYESRGTVYRYTSTLEPHNQTWLLALDYPGAGAPGRYAGSLELRTSVPLRTRRRFDLSAYPEATPGLNEAPVTLSTALLLPPGINPRSHALASQLAAGARDHDQLVDRILDHFRRARLNYKLNPAQLLSTDTVDEFLFDTREGFCEHFSSAFVYLARAAGVPARVVTGYQGGTFNPADNTLVVRQSDAHAWAEVWLAGKGWVRVDPTATAVPQRISAGLSGAVTDQAQLPLLMRPQLHWLRLMRNHWEGFNNSWNQWVIGYNPQRQRDLMEQLGVPNADWAALIRVGALILLGLFGLLVAWGLGRQRRPDPLERAWTRFGRRLARHGLPRHAWEGPQDYGRRCASAMPAHAGPILAITTEYARLRYGADATPEALARLKQQIRQLHIP